jgi:WD40 repeat protein
MRFLLFLLMAAVGAEAQAVKPYPRIETGAHSAMVYRIDVDAAERFLVSASHDKTARVWDLGTGRLLKILRPPIGDGDEGKLYAVAVSPDGKTVAVGGFTGADGASNFPIYIFDRESGTIRQKISGLPEVTHHLTYSRDGRYLAAGLDAKNGIRIFEAGTYSEVARDAGYGDSSYWLEFDRSGRLATVSDDGYVRLYSRDFHLLHKKTAPGGKDPMSARFSPDGKLLVVGFFDSMAVNVLSATDLSLQYKLETPPGEPGLSATSWSADGQTLCAGGVYYVDVNPVLCWSGRGRGRRNALPVAGSTIMDIRALRDGALVFASADGALGVVDRNGVARWRASPDILEYRRGPSFPRLSPDGNNVEVSSYYFNGTSWAHHNLGFSIPDQKLEIDAKPQLIAATTSCLAIDGWEGGYHPTLDGRPLPLKAYEYSRGLAVSPRKDAFVLGTEWYVRKFGRQGEQLWRTPVPGAAWGVNISTDGRFVVAALGDGTIRWYTFDKGEEVLALFVDRDLKRWVAWNPDGFFAFQGAGDSLIGYHLNRGPGREGEFVKVDQLREVFYQSDLIAQILKPGGAQAIVAARARIGDISRVLSGGLPPEIELVSPAEQTVAGDYLLQFRVKDMGGGRGRIVYRIDGAEIEGRAAVDIRGTAADTNSRYIPFEGGRHTLSIAAYTADGKVQGPAKEVRITRSQPLSGGGSNLYLIAAGISHYSDNSLSAGVRFAAADADLVAARFQEQEGRGLYRRVHAVSLRDGKATIKNLQSEVAQAAKAVRPGDTFVLYLAGHGIAVENEYYFIPWEAEYTNQRDLLAKSLNREAIQALLKQIPTNKSVLILDTCGAGAYLESRSSVLSEKAAIEKVALMSGRAVLAASNSDEMAMDGYQNHGVYTYALLEGLQAAQVTADGHILITRLAEYVQGRVPVLTQEKWHYRQSPLSRIDGEPFPIARKPAN